MIYFYIDAFMWHFVHSYLKFQTFFALLFRNLFFYVFKYLLKQIVQLVSILGNHIADRVDPPFVLQNDLRKFSFFVVHI